MAGPGLPCIRLTMRTSPSSDYRRIASKSIGINVHIVGSGPPLILLHGFPQNHRCWAPMMPALCQHYRCVMPDLRGYGDSDTPADDAQHTTYSKRVMALDIVNLMDKLEISCAPVIGHDRGARVAYRLALDHPERISRLVIIEIVPTGDFWRAWTAELSIAAYHWSFLAQPQPFPETLIGAAPQAFADWTLARWTSGRTLSPFRDDALASYRRQMASPAHVAAMCADYRAGATTDRVEDDADRAAGRRIDVPVHFLWSEGGFPAKTGDPLGIWKIWCHTLSGQCVGGCGHFMMEENPSAVAAAALKFLR